MWGHLYTKLVKAKFSVWLSRLVEKASRLYFFVNSRLVVWQTLKLLYLDTWSHKVIAVLWSNWKLFHYSYPHVLERITQVVA